ncbi:MAG: FAD-dependent oxidoreductase [Candidatus Campbellbacteria bacterium]|nr:FAD-dependent oxidoreductase [Candidatus Campbellbacteria bacterium]
MSYDLVIIGGGPAGTSAGVYAARKQIKTLLITETFGGQSIVSPEIQNWIGDISVSGVELAKRFRKHLEAYAKDHLTIKTSSKVTSIQKNGDSFIIKDSKGEEVQTTFVFISSGAGRRKLEGIEGAEELEHKGLTYCASCDGPFFADKDVVVIGGGNAGFETAAQLLAYTKSVTLLQRSDRYKADKITVEKVLANPKMTGILNAGIKKVEGQDKVTGVVYTDRESGEDKKLDAEGVFVEIGLITQTEFLSKDLLEFDEYGRIVVDPKNQRSSTDGIWAAGDCSNGLYHQNNIAAGDAVKAVEDIYIQLTKKK